MYSIKSIILTILLVTGLTIQLNGQITLSNELYDFYAKALVNEKALKVDTSVLRSQIKDCEEIVAIQKEQAEGLRYAVDTKSQIADNYKTSLGTLQTKYDRKVKWLKIAKKVIVTVVAIVVAETIILYYIVTHG